MLKNVSLPLKMKMMIYLAHAIKCLHDQKIIHKDIKAANVFLDL